jgi:hypothetical protein
MSFQLVLEQRLQLLRIEIATDNQPQTVGNELDHVLIGKDMGIFLEQRTFVRRFQIALDAHDTVAPHLGQNLVHELQQRHVVLTLVARPARQAQRPGERRLDHFGRIADEERPHRGTDDDEDLERVPERENMSALGGKASENAPDNHD